MPAFAKILILTGAILILAGLLWWLAGDRMSWLGNLPGDIRIRRSNFSLYIPVTTMLILSGIITLLIWIIRKIF